MGQEREPLRRAMHVDVRRPWSGQGMLLATSAIDGGQYDVTDCDLTPGQMLAAGFLMSSGRMRELRRLGFDMFQSDLSQLDTNELREGVWNWQVLDGHLKACREAGGKWSLCARFHIPSAWFRDGPQFVPVRCRQHDAPFPGWSIWHPGAAAFQDRCYRALRKQFDESIFALSVGGHGDYGENMYPAGCWVGSESERGKWRERFGDAHNHIGWWCQDSFAREDFARAALDKYGTLTRVNDAWGTSFPDPERIDYPCSTERRRYWLDFVNWYLDSMTRYCTAITKVARKHFPVGRMFWLLGAGDEQPQIGQDQSGQVKAAGEIGIEIRSTHGGCQPFAKNYATMHKRIASACKFYGVPFWTEPPYVMNPPRAVGRIFEAASCGAVAFYDWAWNPLRPAVAEVYEAYGRYLTLEKPVVDVALFFPTTHHYLNALQSPEEAGYPKRFEALAMRVREVFDFDILDERMIVDGALKGYRILAFLEGSVAEASTLEAIADWVRAGGVAVTYDLGAFQTVEGDARPWRDLFGIGGEFTAVSGRQTIAEQWRPFVNHLSERAAALTDQVCVSPAAEAEILVGEKGAAAVWATPRGDGWSIAFAGSWDTRDTYCELLRDVVYNLSALDPSKQDALAVDDRWDGVYSTCFEGGKVLLYNPTSQAVCVDVFGATVRLEPVSLGHAYIERA